MVVATSRRIVADRVYGRAPRQFRVEEACAAAARVHPDGRRGRRARSPSGPSSGARPSPRRSDPRPARTGRWEPRTRNGLRLPARLPLTARGSSAAAGERHHPPVAPLPRRPGHLPDARRRLDPRVELRGARLDRRRRRRDPLRLQRPDPRRLPDPRRHERQLLGRGDAVGHLALVRGGGHAAACGSAIPAGSRPAVARPALGVFKHEAAAVDPRGQARLPDRGPGRRRLLPLHAHDAGRTSSAGQARDRGGARRTGRSRWHEVPDPSAATTPTRQQVPGSTPFARGEGIWFDSGIVYVATTARQQGPRLRHALAADRGDLRRRQAHRPAAHRRRQHHRGALGRPLRVRGQRHRRARHRPDHPGPADRPLPHRHRRPITRPRSSPEWCSTRAGAGSTSPRSASTAPAPSSRSAGRSARRWL